MAGVSPARENAVKSLDGATAAQLVAALKSDNMFWRTHAQRLLVERGRPTSCRLIALVKDPGRCDRPEYGGDSRPADAGGVDVARTTVKQRRLPALKHPSAGVRRNAIQVIAPGARRPPS